MKLLATHIVGLVTLAQHSSNVNNSTVAVLLFSKRWHYKYAPTRFFIKGPMVDQHMLADCHIVIFFNIVKFSLIFQIRRWELFLRKDESQNQIKRFFEECRVAKLVSIKHKHKQRNTGTICRVGKLFLWMKHFRNDPIYRREFHMWESFAGVLFSEDHPAVTCYNCRSWLEWFWWCVVASLYCSSCLSRLTVR